MDIALQPASVTSQITVTEAPPELQTETAEVNSEMIRHRSALADDLVQGRNFEALYTLIPGAARCRKRTPSFEPFARHVRERERHLV